MSILSIKPLNFVSMVLATCFVFMVCVYTATVHAQLVEPATGLSGQADLNAAPPAPNQNGAPPAPNQNGAPPAPNQPQQTDTITKNTELKNPLGGINSLTELLLALVDILLILAVPIVGAFAVYSGFLYVAARGNPEKISAAHRAITWTLVGAIVIFSAAAIVQILKATVDAFK